MAALSLAPCVSEVGAALQQHPKFADDLGIFANLPLCEVAQIHFSGFMVEDIGAAWDKPYIFFCNMNSLTYFPFSKAPSGQYGQAITHHSQGLKSSQ